MTAAVDTDDEHICNAGHDAFCDQCINMRKDAIKKISTALDGVPIRLAIDILASTVAFTISEVSEAHTQSALDVYDADFEYYIDAYSEAQQSVDQIESQAVVLN